MVRQETPFSSLVMGAIYALLRGDLETAIELGEQSLEQSPYSVESYIILVHAHSGLERWIEAARYGRLALCCGAQDPQIGSFMAGVYRALGMNEESHWVEDRCSSEPFELEWDLDESEIAGLERELSQIPKPPKVQSGFSSPSLKAAEDPTNSFSWNGGSEGELPQWLEANESLNPVMISASTQESLDWLLNGEDSLEAIFEQYSDIPDWLTSAESISHHFNDEVFIVSEATTQPSSRESASDAIADGRPRLPSTLPHSDETLLEPNREELNQALIESSAHATSLGVGENFMVALDLVSLTLSSPGAKQKTLFGPLILALTDQRLILVAYEEDQVRQRPWAFTSSQLNGMSSEESAISLLLEGGREIAFRLKSPSLARRLVEIVTEWKTSGA